MKVTKKQYERARAVVKDAQEQSKIVNFWEEGTRGFGPRETHEVVAVEQRENGVIDIKCRLIAKATRADSSDTKSPPSLSAPLSSTKVERSVQ